MAIRRGLPVRPLVLAALPVLGVLGTALSMGSVSGVFTGSTSNPGNRWSVASSQVALARTVFNGPFPVVSTGTLSGFAGSENVAYRLDAATVLAGSPSAVAANGAATITSLAIPSVADGTHTLYVLGSFGSEASLTITVDTAAPTASASSSPAANGAGWNTGPVQVSLSGNDGGGSGVQQIRYTTDGSDPRSSGTAVVYGAPIPVAATTTVRYYAIDAAGNESVVGTKLVKIDSVGPANALTLVTTSGNAVLSGATVHYRGTNAGSFTLTDAVTDASSGAASGTFAALGGTSTGWTHVAGTVSTPAGGPYVSSAFTWPAGTSSAPTETVTGADVAGNTTATGLSFVNDSTPPSGGAVDATGLTGRYSTSTGLGVAFTAGTDAGAGLAPTGRVLARAAATLTAGSCGAYGGYATIATDTASPYPDTVPDQACYRYRYTVPDLLGNATAYLSGDVKVDSTAPSTPTFGVSATTNAYGSGTTVYYRPGATSGSFTMAGSSTDAASGIASYAFPALGAGWTSTPGGLGLNTYGWSSANPAAPTPKTFTSTNNAGLASAGSAFTVTADSTAPAGATISYANGYSVAPSITFTGGTDAGAGVDASAGVLKRATATLTGGTCGAYGAYLTLVTGAVSPYVDSTVGNGSCYQYRYFATDYVGNQAAPATSANVVKVDYATGVDATAGLSAYWRMGEDNLGFDTFTGGSGSSLMSHTDDAGFGWNLRAGTAPVLSNAGRVRKSGANGFDAFNTADPPSADYSVETDLYVANKAGEQWIGVMGRVNPANAYGTGTYYYTEYDAVNDRWILFKKINGTSTQIGSTYSQALVNGHTYRLRLEMTGTAISVWVDGVKVISASDNAVNNTGTGGIFNWGSLSVTNTTGIHFDDFAITGRLTDSHGGNTGDYFSGPRLGVAGGIIGDSDTAVAFDGAGSYATVRDAAALDLGDGPLTIEAWVKRADSSTATQTIVDKGTGAYQLAFKNNKIGLYEGGTATAIAQSSGTITDTAFHHVVATKSGATTKIYVDGVDVTVAGTNQSLANNSTALTIGAGFNGRLDEIAVYTVALSASVIAGHYAVGN